MADREPVSGGRRRRENAPGGRRHAHKVLVTPQEEAALLARANRLGITVPRLLVEAALNDDAGASLETKAADTEFRRQVLTELFALQRTVAVSANNINQIAKVANATGEVDPSLGTSLTHLRKVLWRVEEELDQWAVRP